MTWSDARDYCDEYYDGLATPKTEYELKTIQLMIDENRGLLGVWIGLYRNESTGIWYWTDGTPLQLGFILKMSTL